MIRLLLSLFILFVLSCDKENPVIPDTTPPTVSITSPLDGQTVTEIVTISILSEDNVEVTKIEFYINDSLKFIDTESPYEYDWNTLEFEDGEYNRNYIRTGLGYGIFYGDYELTLNCGIKDISIGEKYSFDVIKDYNMKYTYGVLIKINRISFSFSGYQSFIPMPAFNSYNGTISIGI